MAPGRADPADWQRSPEACLAAAPGDGKSRALLREAATPALRPFLGLVTPEFQRWTSAHFDGYARAFLAETGRIVDRENRGISHSEGQGYGMLLAVQADDGQAFSRIWRFTRKNLRRPDHLFSWKYDPRGNPAVADLNNASDGDVLIASALALAAIRWDRPDYLAAAIETARDIRTLLLVDYRGYTLLLPGIEGFVRLPVPHKFARLLGIPALQSPVINLSYWIFPFLELLDTIDPDPLWVKLEASGLELLSRTPDLPTEWSVVSEAGTLEPAPGRPAGFGYNAVRIPLYLQMAGYRLPNVERRLLAVWGMPGPDRPFTFGHRSTLRRDYMNLAGFRLVHGLLACRATGMPVAPELLWAQVESYYATSIWLLAINVLYTYEPQCFPHEAGP